MNTENTGKIERKIGIIKIAIDMHLRSYRVVIQAGHCAPQPAQKFEPAKFYPWLRRQLAKAERVALCYEAGCFGYEPARRMKEMGAEVYVIAPQNWDEQRKRQVNDKLDAQVMCRRLGSYLEGDKKALSVVRIPTPEEEARRRKGRFREQLRKEVRRMQAMGRSLLLQRQMALKGRWWNAKAWGQILQRMPGWVAQELEAWREIILLVEAKARRLELELRAEAPKSLFLGEGGLSHELVKRELADPGRFKTARQVGNYFGLCPSESSTGDSRRMGSITKHGNPRLRRLMIEVAWRLLNYQPRYRGVEKWGPILRDKARGAGARKKAIVALARWLAVDLWRMATGRKTPAELGLALKNA
jgi:transposase